MQSFIPRLGTYIPSLGMYVSGLGMYVSRLGMEFSIAYFTITFLPPIMLIPIFGAANRRPERLYMRAFFLIYKNLQNQI